jgi:hypothetical protein
MSALVCEDCGKTLIADSVQYINLILQRLETLEERISTLERAGEADCEAQATPDRDAQYRIAA